MARQSVMFEDACVSKTPYEPLPSVWFGSDAELVERMLMFYP